MQYIWKEIEFNYNVSEKRSLNKALKYFLYFLWFVFGLFLLFYIIAFMMTKFISIEKEKQIFGNVFIDTLNIDEDLTNYLKNIVWDLPYEIYVVDDENDEPNAYAFLGWSIIITKELLMDLEYKNTLLFIIWHEISHIENRDIIMRLIGRIPINLILMIVSINSSFDANSIWNSLLLPFDKNVEIRADKEWIEFVYKQSWNVWCITDFFEKYNTSFENFFEIFTEHPSTLLRINNIKKYVADKWYQNGQCEKLQINLLESK